MQSRKAASKSDVYSGGCGKKAVMAQMRHDENMSRGDREGSVADSYEGKIKVNVNLYSTSS